MRRWWTRGAGRDCSILWALIDKVDDDVAYGDTVAMREPVRVVDPGPIDQHAVAAVEGVGQVRVDVAGAGARQQHLLPAHVQLAGDDR